MAGLRFSLVVTLREVGVSAPTPLVPDPSGGPTVAKVTCSADEGCDRPVHARGLCTKHYQRRNRHGSTAYHRPTVEQRFWQKVNKNGPLPRWAPFLGPCWIWTASENGHGYGQFRGAGADPSGNAHRFSYSMLVGSIPDGLHIDHLCRVKLCVNPMHLEPVTVRENLLRGMGWAGEFARRTHCVHGHPFDEANTRYNKSGGRACRACHRRWAAQRRQRLSTIA